MSLVQQKWNKLGWLKSLPRVFVGLILLSTGLGKLLDMPGFVSVLDAYQLMPYWMSTALAYSLPFIELFTGLNLVITPRPIRGAWVAVVLHALMLTTVAITLQRGIRVENCGCFGVFLARPLTLQTLVEDLVMLMMSILALIQAKRGNSQY